jgi:hypothetical protein
MRTGRFLNELAPCGLNCGKCFAYKRSDIKKYSSALRERLGNFDKHAKRFSSLLNNTVFDHYSYFKDQLDYFADTICEGCRHEKCKLFQGCRVRECSKEKKVDFCYQCIEFPCTQTGFDENLEKRWLQNNILMKKIGARAYYQKVKNYPRYQ